MANNEQGAEKYNLDTIGSVGYIARRVEELLCDLKNTFYLDKLDFTHGLITDDAQQDNFKRFRQMVDYAYGLKDPTDQDLEDIAKYDDLVKSVRNVANTICEDYESYAAAEKLQYPDKVCAQLCVHVYCSIKNIEHTRPISDDAMEAKGKRKTPLKNRDRLKALKPILNELPQLSKKLIFLVAREILEKKILNERMTLGNYIHKVFVSPAQRSSATQSVAARIADQFCKDPKYKEEVKDILKWMKTERSRGDKSVRPNELGERVKGTALYKDIATEKLDADFNIADGLTRIANIVSKGKSPPDLSDSSESTVDEQSMDPATELLRKWNNSELAEALREAEKSETKVRTNPDRFNAKSQIVVWLADKLNDTEKVKVRKLYEDLEYIRERRNETLHYDGKSNVKVDMDKLKRKYKWILKESGVFEVVYGELELIPAKLDSKKKEWLKIEQDFSDLKYVKSQLNEQLELAYERGDDDYYEVLSSLLATIKEKQDDYLSKHDEKKLQLDMTDFYRSEIEPKVDHLERGAPEWKKAMKNRLTAANFYSAIKTPGPQFNPDMLTDLIESKVIMRKRVLRNKYIQFLCDNYEGKYTRENVQLPPFDGMRQGVDADGFPGMKLIENYPELGATPEAIVKKDGTVHLVMMRGIIQNLKKSTLKGDISQLKDLSGQGDPHDLNLITEDEWYEIAGLFMAFPDIKMCDYVACANGKVCNVFTIKHNHWYVKEISGQSTLEKLREFYFGAMLPQLASPSVTVRESFIDLEMISEFFPKTQNLSSPDSKSSSCAPKPATEA